MVNHWWGQRKQLRGLLSLAFLGCVFSSALLLAGSPLVSPPDGSSPLSLPQPSKASFLDSDCAERLAQRRSEGLVSGNNIAFDESRVVFHGNPFNRFQPVFDAELDTVRFQNKQGRVSPNSAVFIPLFHGNGATFSHSGAMMNALSIFSPLGRRKKANNRGPSTVARLKEDPAYLITSAEALDFPFHGAGPRGEEFWNLNPNIEWLAKYLREVKSLGLPVVPIARSGSTGLLIAVIQKYPQLIDGMILVSPVHPVVGFDESLAHEKRKATADPGRRNWEGFNWIVEIYKQMVPLWGHLEDPLRNIPTLVLIGKEDEDLLPPVREGFRRIVERSSAAGGKSYYLEVEGAQHDAISPSPKETAFSVYRRIYQFLNEVLANRQG